jgi:hypothetical protein
MTVNLLRGWWQESGDRLDRRMEGLTDEEYFWEPVAECWTVKPDVDRPGRWTYEYDFAPPAPAPVTTLSWRLVHITADNLIYWEHAFGPGVRNFPDLPVPSTAAAALEAWRASRQPVTEWLAGASDADLADLHPSHLGDPRTAAEVITILLDEQIHHGAEIALLRDLYLRLG